MKVLTITVEDCTYEIHMCNVGEVFPPEFHDSIAKGERPMGWGGSRHPLTIGRDFATGERIKKPSASLIIRRRSLMGLVDEERDIWEPGFWMFLAKLINGKDETVSAEAVSFHS